MSQNPESDLTADHTPRVSSTGVTRYLETPGFRFVIGADQNCLARAEASPYMMRLMGGICSCSKCLVTPVSKIRFVIRDVHQTPLPAKLTWTYEERERGICSCSKCLVTPVELTCGVWSGRSDS